jgi:hypothetical protein
MRIIISIISVLFSAAIGQAFVANCDVTRKEKYPVFSCEHCPMYWYNKLCQEIEGKIFEQELHSKSNQ